MYYFLFFVLIVFVLYACKKEGIDKNDPPKVNAGLIDSIYVSKDSLKAWMDTAFIKVFPSRPGLEIRWSVDHGTLKGSGNAVYYFAGECCLGINTIECKVISDTAMQQIDIPVLVYSYFN